MAVEHLRKTVGGDKLYARVAEYDSAGNKIVDSLSTLSDSVDAVSDSVTAVTMALDGKANLVQNPTTGNFVSLTGTGDIADSGYNPSNLLPSAINKKSQVLMVDGQDTPVWSSDVYVTAPINDPNMKMVTIGGTEYIAIKVGNLWWMAENLDYKFNGCIIGSTEGLSNTEPRGNYYNDDEALYGRSGYKCGLLYNWNAVKMLNENADTLIPGWRVPTYQDWTDFLVYNDAEGPYHAYKFKKGGLPWAPDWHGTNTTNFSVLPSGILLERFNFVGTITEFWSSTYASDTTPEYPTMKAVKFDTTYGVGMESNTGNGWHQYPVRLVCDDV